MRRTALLLLALLACAGLVAGCGTSGGETSSSTTATTTADDGGDEGTEPADTTEPERPGDDEVGAPTDDEGSAIDTSELEALLPTEEEVGNGYVLDTSADDGSSDSATDEQFREACPGLAQLDFLDDAEDDDDDGSVKTTFTTEDDRELEVELDPTSEDFTEENLDQLVDAFADCEDIQITDEDGFDYTITIRAQPDGSRGDFGIRVDMDVAIDFMGVPVELQFAGQAFKIDDIGVFVSATSGIEETETDFSPVPLDEDLLGDISDLMENRVNDR